MITVPLPALKVSPANVRKTVSSDSIDELAKSIHAHGLLQNLSVVAVDDDQYQVIAGGLRLRALQKLAKDGLIADGYPVPCNLVGADAAAEASLAENVARSVMHPADEFEAFQKLATGPEKASAAEIAARFGKTELYVKQRLNLAKVSPKLIAAYRAGEMSLELLQVFTLTSDKPRQERVWKECNGQRGSWLVEHVRSALTDKELEFPTDDDARFVGVEAYKAAGGFVRKDLFSSHAYFADAALVQKLVEQALDAKVEELKADGWAWVEVERGWFNSYFFAKKTPKKRELSPEEKKQLARLSKERDQLRGEIDALEEADDSDSEKYYKKSDRFDAIEDEIQQVNDALLTWSAKQKAESGVVLEYRSGSLRAHRGLIKPADAKKAAKDKAKKAKGAGEPEETGLSASMWQRLTGQRTAVLQGLLMNSPKVAHAVLAYALIQQTLLLNRWWPSLGAIRLETMESHFRAASVPDEFPARVNCEGILDDWRSDIPDDPLQALERLLTLPPGDLDKLIAACVATSFNAMAATADTDREPLVQRVARAVGLDMADHWTATRASFFDHVTKAVIIEAVTEARGADEAKPLLAMKKGDAAQAAEELLAGTRWLPAPLRNASSGEAPGKPKKAKRTT